MVVWLVVVVRSGVAGAADSSPVVFADCVVVLYNAGTKVLGVISVVKVLFKLIV